MFGGMNQVGPFPNPVAAFLVLVALPAFIAWTVYRGEKARRNHAEELIRKRTRRVYVCFLGWGIFLCVVAAVAIVSEPMLEFVGIFGAIPVTIIAVVGLFNALMVWRARTIQILLLATILFAGVLAAVPTLSNAWSAVMGGAYGLGVIVIAVHGLHSLRED
jgi:hypothetical protein